MTFKLLIYMLIINITPFVIYDRFYYYYLPQERVSLDALLMWWPTRIVLFALVYTIIQYVLFQFLLKNLFNRKLVSTYVRE